MCFSGIRCEIIYLVPFLKYWSKYMLSVSMKKAASIVKEDRLSEAKHYFGSC